MTFRNFSEPESVTNPQIKNALIKSYLNLNKNFLNSIKILFKNFLKLDYTPNRKQTKYKYLIT